MTSKASTRTASAPRISSRTPTPCCTTRCTATTTPPTCSASFPRLPLYHEFDIWARMGRKLLDLHIGFESVEPYPLKRVEKSSPVKTAKTAREASPNSARLGQPIPGQGASRRTL